ncbi:hypothetical protein Pint_06204 [Pistacia integerrima]|uniref:Uncharacterized protein n=1 Tax=Pistacia integerrima TaxID=434235 RepID=A0ACC0Z3U0_9ROSI|nr:hypothetical protein Pint_06204 [Pistacia integerrima]
MYFTNSNHSLLVGYTCSSICSSEDHRIFWTMGDSSAAFLRTYGNLELLGAMHDREVLAIPHDKRRMHGSFFEIWKHRACIIASTVRKELEKENKELELKSKRRSNFGRRAESNDGENNIGFLQN